MGIFDKLLGRVKEPDKESPQDDYVSKLIENRDVDGLIRALDHEDKRIRMRAIVPLSFESEGLKPLFNALPLVDTKGREDEHYYIATELWAGLLRLHSKVWSDMFHRVDEILKETNDPEMRTDIIYEFFAKIVEELVFDGKKLNPEQFERLVFLVRTNLGEQEKVKCAMCGKTLPVALTREVHIAEKVSRGFGGIEKQVKRFCVDDCWSKRGRMLAGKDGADCPHYSTDRMCLAGGDEPLPCSFTFRVGPSYTECHVYSLHPVTNDN